jgi:transposase
MSWKSLFVRRWVLRQIYVLMRELVQGVRTARVNFLVIRKVSVRSWTCLSLMGRSGAYQSSIQANLPGAAIVYDRFHLMMNLNQAVYQVRGQQWREASEQDRSVIKGSRFLLLAHAKNLSDTGEVKLQALLRANEGLSMAYQLKEQFKGILQYQKQGWALRALDQW